MLSYNTTYEYETSYKGTFMITHYWTNGMVTLQYDAEKIRYNIPPIQPHISHTNVEHIKPVTND